MSGEVTPESIRTAALAIAAPISAWCAGKVSMLINEREDDAEDDFALLTDNLSNAAYHLREEGAECMNEGDTLAHRLEGAEMLGAAARLDELSDTARREFHRTRIRDHVRSTLSSPASETIHLIAAE